VVVAACGDDGSSGSKDAAGNVEMLHVTPGTPPCFMAALADVDSTMTGAQYDCSVTRTATGKVYPKCNDQQIPARSTNQPCWAIATNAGDCTTGSRYELQIIPQITEQCDAQCVVR
jgi:hypothetical protein